MRTAGTGRKDAAPDGFRGFYRQGMSTPAETHHRGARLPDTPPAETALLRRIRESVIGDDQVCPARTVRGGSRTPTTPPPGGRSASSRTSSATRCCRATRTRTPSPAAPGCRPPGCARTPARSSTSAVGGDDETVVIFAGSGCTGAIDKLVGILGLRIPAELEDRYRPDATDPRRTERPVVFIGPFEHHSNELPWRESIADVVVIPAGRRRPHRPRTGSSRAGRVRRPAAAGSARSPRPATSPGIVSDTHGDLGAAAPARRAVVLGLRRRRAVRRHRCPTDLAGKDAIFLSPHKFIGGPGTPGRARRPPRAADQPGARRPRRRHGRLRQPDRAPLPRRPGAARGGRHARRSSSRSGPGWSSSSSRPSGIEVIRAHEEHYLRRAVEAWQARAGDRDPRQPRRRAAVDRLVRGPRARAGATCTTTSSSPLLNDLFGIQSRGGCSCAGPYGHRLLGIDLERSHEFEREIAARLRGDQARLGAGQLQLLHLRGGVRVRRRRGAAGRRATAGGCCRTTVSTRRPGCGGTAGPGRAAAAAGPGDATTPTA